MSKRRRRAAYLEHVKHAREKAKKDRIQKSTMVYCKFCNFGWNLSEYSNCPGCGALYTKLTELKERVENPIPRKDRCCWCEERKFHKIYEKCVSNLGVNLKLCLRCAIVLGREKKEDHPELEENTEGAETENVEHTREEEPVSVLGTS